MFEYNRLSTARSSLLGRIAYSVKLKFNEAVFIVAYEKIWRVGQGSSRVYREDVTSMLRGKRFRGI